MSWIEVESAAPPERREAPCREHRGLWISVVIGAALAIGIFGEWLEISPLPLRNSASLPRPVISSTNVSLRTPEYTLISELVAYRDEIFAYLMFDYLRYSPSLRGARLLLTYDQAADVSPYRLVVRGEDDLLQAIPDVASTRLAGTLRTTGWRLVPTSYVQRLEEQTKVFTAAYTLPVRQKLEQLSRESISRYLQRFIRFKSATDGRIRLGLEPVPTPLSSKEAQQLAGDILTIADFYSLPLEFFIGIGAMENNYMNVRGDLEHSVWKRRAAPDDVVLEKRRGRVRILNDSAGVWQITRETLRYAHKLIKRDHRDYSQLPEHLRPPAELSVTEVDPHVLTTYAGVLLRDLLDRFNGDVTLAVSAYNGGPARPNLRYGEGVQRAAEHARHVMEQAASLNGESVVNTTWLRR